MEIDQEQIDRKIARRSALIFLPVSLGAALAFLLAASQAGSYPLVARIGGTVWVGLLSLIISMPLITSRVKRYVLSR
jgi:hypothetical protein